MKPLIYLMSLMMLVTSVEAGKARANRGNAKKVREVAKQREKEKKQQKEARDKKREAIEKVLNKKDGNNDGSLTLDEFLTGESDAKAATNRFNNANKNGDRYLSKAEISDMLGL
jgi:hypothetical protein